MRRDWKEIEARAEKAEIEPETTQQPLDKDNWHQRFSRILHLENDDYPDRLAENHFELLDQVSKYIRQLKGELSNVAESFREYKRLHPETNETLLDTLLERNTRLENELEGIKKSNEVLLAGSGLRDQEIERLRQALVELQNRLDGAKTRG